MIFKDVPIGEFFYNQRFHYKLLKLSIHECYDMQGNYHILFNEDDEVTLYKKCDSCKHLKKLGEGFSACKKTHLSWDSANPKDFEVSHKTNTFSCSLFEKVD